MQAKLEVGKWQDVIEMRKELGKARENLAEVKAIQLYISQERPAITSTVTLFYLFIFYSTGAGCTKKRLKLTILKQTSTNQNHVLYFVLNYYLTTKQ